VVAPTPSASTPPAVSPPRGRALQPSTVTATTSSSAGVQRNAPRSDSALAPVQLIDDHIRRVAATAQFPPQISHSCVRDCLSRFDDHITAGITATRHICGSCGSFIVEQLFRLSENDPLLLHVGSAVSPRLDSCALVGTEYLFCRPCFTAIHQGAPPKYSALNAVNVTFCQHYPAVLRDLTLTEECLIARGHPIASILKLRPLGAYNPGAYSRLRGHVIVLPQEPGPLLDILPSVDVNLDDKIKVVWFGDRPPVADDLKPYLEVRKEVVFRALQWLRLHNQLYRHITINRDLLDRWADSFIPPELQDSIVHSRSDHEEREGYAADLEVGNCENDFQEALVDQANALVSTGCVYSDVESARQHPTLHLVSAILNLERDRLETEPSTAGGEGSGGSSAGAASHYIEDIPVIRYTSSGHSVMMNDWQDAEFFTGSFPTLFPLGAGGHLPVPPARSVPVSLKAWAKWALGHHSRRYVS
jgi:Domain of unknown function (DUF6570)